MPTPEAIQQEVERNYKAFQAALPTIPGAQSGKHALLHQGAIIEYFDSVADAVKYGKVAFPDGLFSVQQVSNIVVDLGYFSHARAG